MNQKVNNAIGGYEDCHAVNQPKGLDAYAMPKPYPTMEQVEASRDPYHVPSPIYTREELVDCIAKAMNAEWFAHGKEGLTPRIDVALDALIAIGAVRVK